MKKVLSYKGATELYHKVDGVVIPRAHSRLVGDTLSLRGDCTNLYGECYGLFGDCTKLSGDCTGVCGDCTGYSGNLDLAELTEEERERGVSLSSLVP